MNKLTKLFFAAIMSVSLTAAAGYWEDTFPDHIAMEVSSGLTTFKDKNGNLSMAGSTLILYDVRGRMMDASADPKAVKAVLKSKTSGVCDIYYNPFSPNLDGNATLILSKKANLKAMGIPTGIGKPMGTFVKYKTALPNGATGYIIADFRPDDLKFHGQTIRDDLSVWSTYNSQF